MDNLVRWVLLGESRASILVFVASAMTAGGLVGMLVIGFLLLV